MPRPFDSKNTKRQSKKHITKSRPRIDTWKKRHKNNKSTGVRYTEAQKDRVIAFVLKHNKKAGGGGMTKATMKYGVSIVTIARWLNQ